MPKRVLTLVAGASLLLATAVDGAAAETARPISVASCEPLQLSLAASTWCGSDVLDALFTGLVEYDPKTGATVNAMARSITTTDNRLFTIHLKKGWTFHDGTEVTARHYVDSWNRAAATNSYLFERIQGYGSRRMSGLRVTGEHSFTVKLAKPYGPFPNLLGALAFSPARDSRLSLGRVVGNGPYELVSWKSGGKAVLKAVKGYPGPRKPQAATLHYDMIDGGLGHLALKKGLVDVANLPDRTSHPRRVVQPFAEIMTIDLPFNKPAVARSVDFRRALSMAIDRKKVLGAAFGAERAPADALVPPGALGARRGTCGVWCTYAPAKARALLKEPEVTLPLHYNSDGGHRKWVEAVARSINTTLAGKVKVVLTPRPRFGVISDEAAKGRLNGAFTMAWLFDQPHIANFLAPMYRTGAPANYQGYRNKRFDALVDAADRQRSSSRAIGMYQDAERLLIKDMVAIPVGFYRSVTGYSARVAPPALTPFGWVDPTSLRTR